MPKKNIPLLALKLILKEQGAIRIKDDALEELRDLLEKEVEDIGFLARRYAQHANRKTILESDIELAIREQQK